MPAKEIKELRQAGKLEEAYAMAKAELEADLSNIWGKRNLSWVLYAQLDGLALNIVAFIEKINEVKELDLPASEEMFFENVSIVIAKAARGITHEAILDINKIHQLFDAIKVLPLKRNSKWFSVLFTAMHKGMKESHRYIEFADWWDFENFRPEDFQKEKLPNGREVMAIAEQAYIAYAKQLLPKVTAWGEVFFDKIKVNKFLPILSKVVEDYPHFQYPGYFLAKLLLASGEKDNVLLALLPFARKKRSEFWVWEILSEAFSDDSDKIFACYCKALTCRSQEEMLVNLRQKMARLLILKNKFKEAKTEIELLIKARTEKGYKIPQEVVFWQSMEWYINAKCDKSNMQFYKLYVSVADALLFNDIEEEMVIVEFVNSEKKILNFIASENKIGFFKYDRFLNNVKIGDVLSVRFQGGTNEGMYQLYSLTKNTDNIFKEKYVKIINGVVKIKNGNSFGFIDDVFIHPAIIKKYLLSDGITFSGSAIKSYNKEKKMWGWKLF